MTDTIVAAVAEARLNSEPVPLNETETCQRIIYPLLLAAGYMHVEIRAQDLDAGGKKPDYTILPGSPEHTWFLEAKAWSVTLDDNHAIQAINYANTQGKRWVALTNGREWRLYDNHTLGTPDVKLACVALLGEESFGSFLQALSRQSVTQGKLEAYVRNERLYSSLRNQITRADSDIVKALVKVLRNTPGLSGVQSSDVAGFFTSYLEGADQLSDPSPVPSPVFLAEPAPTSAPSNSRVLGSIPRSEVTGTRPLSLELPDGSTAVVTKWNRLTLTVASFIQKEGRLPALPFYASPKSKNPLLAIFQSQEMNQMREPLLLAGGQVVVEGHFSANGHQLVSMRLIHACGYQANSFNIRIQSCAEYAKQHASSG